MNTEEVDSRLQRVLTAARQEDAVRRLAEKPRMDRVAVLQIAKRDAVNDMPNILSRIEEASINHRRSIDVVLKPDINWHNTSQYMSVYMAVIKQTLRRDFSVSERHPVDGYPPNSFSIKW